MGACRKKGSRNLLQKIENLDTQFYFCFKCLIDLLKVGLVEGVRQIRIVKTQRIYLAKQRHRLYDNFIHYFLSNVYVFKTKNYLNFTMRLPLIIRIQKWESGTRPLESTFGQKSKRREFSYRFFFALVHNKYDFRNGSDS